MINSLPRGQQHHLHNIYLTPQISQIPTSSRTPQHPLSPPHQAPQSRDTSVRLSLQPREKSWARDATDVNPSQARNCLFQRGSDDAAVHWEDLLEQSAYHQTRSFFRYVLYILFVLGEVGGRKRSGQGRREMGLYGRVGKDEG